MRSVSISATSAGDTQLTFSAAPKTLLPGTAIKLQGGAFGCGMQFLAWGFVVMAVGHLHMQIERYTGVNLFDSLLGQTIGDIFWILALVITWALSAYGFLQIYRAAKG